jgi:hypothetical protein
VIKAPRASSLGALSAAHARCIESAAGFGCAGSSGNASNVRRAAINSFSKKKIQVNIDKGGPALVHPEHAKLVVWADHSVSTVAGAVTR